MENELRNIPVIPLRYNLVLPGMQAEFDITEEQDIQAYRYALDGTGEENREKGILFLIYPKDPTMTELESTDFQPIGTIVRIHESTEETDGCVHLVVTGLSAASCASQWRKGPHSEEEEDERTLERAAEHNNCLMATVFKRPDFSLGDMEEWQERAMLQATRELMTSFCQESRAMSMEELDEEFGDLGLVDAVEHLAGVIDFPTAEKYNLLRADNFQEFFSVFCEMIRIIIEVCRIRNSLDFKVQEKMDEDQRKYYLRTQMSVIRKELGLEASDADKLRMRVDELDAKESVKNILRAEITKMESMAGDNVEAVKIKSYIETVLELPWNKKTQDNMDLANAAKVLAEDHYGLEKVKERILEYLAVRVLNKSGNTPVLCLVGPPGTGKTSIAHSVARALGRKYTRIALGGVSNEVVIRGHSRTYVGSQPGQIARELKKCGVANPVMVLDEIDKVGRANVNGDVSAAFLEILDPEQNSHFHDTYVEIPIDLSPVLFIATANDLGDIPRALADRMEIIEVSSYTEKEKMHIAKDHLVEKQKKANGLQKEQLKISPKALEMIISGYTREAGVRSLDRMIGQVCRKAARKLVEGNMDCVKVNAADLEEYLGQPRFRTDAIDHTDFVGICHGLAWTSVGGVTLEIEVNVMPGKGALILTGQMGDVMKESAQAGISFIRSQSEKLGIAADYFEKHDIHVHIPEGAIPKDGPSAGITMATAITSAITGRKVRGDIAMTGEITLRGRVLAIGGLNEKLLAAGKAGFKTVLVPKVNKADVSEIDEEITGSLDIIYVSDMEEVLERALRKSE